MRKYRVKKASRYKHKKPITCRPDLSQSPCLLYLPASCIETTTKEERPTVTWFEKLSPGYYNALCEWARRLSSPHSSSKGDGSE